MVSEHLQKKKIETTIHTLMKMSRLPLKDPKTFGNFDFSVVNDRDATKLKTLPFGPSMPTETWRSLALPELARPIWPRH